MHVALWCVEAVYLRLSLSVALVNTLITNNVQRCKVLSHAVFGSCTRGCVDLCIYFLFFLCVWFFDMRAVPCHCI